MNQEQALAILQIFAKASREGFDYPFTFDPVRARHAAETMQVVADKEVGFDLSSWITSLNVEDVHSCGTTACIMGHIALTPEWAEAGGSYEVNEGHCDIHLLESSGISAARKWFEAKRDPAGAQLQMLIFSRGHDISLLRVLECCDPELAQVFLSSGLPPRYLTVAISPWFRDLALDDFTNAKPDLNHVVEVFNSIAERQKATTYIRIYKGSILFSPGGIMAALADKAGIAISEVMTMLFGEQA